MTEMPKNWDSNIVEEYIKPESQQKSPEVFRETHVSIDKIRADILRPYEGDSGFVTEEEFRDAVLDSKIEDDNRIFIVKGEVGSGKSHLCQWLEYEINGYGDKSGHDDNHVAIHISRSNTKLDEILEILHEPIDKEYEEVGDVGSLDPEDVADFIIQGLKTFHKDRGQLKGFELEKFLKEFDSKESFRDVLVENLSNYQEAVEQEGKEQPIELLSREDFGRVCLNAFGTTQHQADTYPALRRAVHDLLTNNLGIENFKGQLRELSKAYVEAGKRPVLICEDLTTFNVLKDDLLDHIFELSSSHYDIVLGWTSGWERENIDDALSTSEDSLSYMQQRCQGYLSMTDDQGRAYFLEDKSASIVLVKQYLKAIKKHSEAEADIPEGEFDQMYPFNEAFVHHVYQNLVQDGNRQQTPRVLLVHVISDCLTANSPPFEKVETNAFVESRPSLVSLEETDDCQQLTKWYAKMDSDEDVLWLPEAVFDTFGVGFKTGYIDEENVLFEPEYATYGVDILKASSGKRDSEDGGPSGYDGGGEPGEGPDEGGKEPGGKKEEGPEGGTEEGGPSTAPPIPGDKQAHFQKWLKHGSEYPSSNLLKKGVRMTLERWYEPTRLANENSTARSTTGIYCAQGSDTPVEIKGPDAPSSLSYTIEHGVDKHKLYNPMLYAGVNEEFDPNANFDRLRGWADDMVIEYRHDMREEIEDYLPELMGIEEFVVLSKFLLMNTGDGVDEVDRDILFKEYKLKETSPLYRDARMDIDVPIGMADAFDEMTRKSSDFEGLVRGFFLLKKNVVDYQRLKDAITTVNENLDEFIEQMAFVSVEDLPGAYRVGTSRSSANTELKTLITGVSDFANELLKLQQEVSFEAIEEEVERYSDVYSTTHTREKLLNVYETLDKSVAPLQVTKLQDWQDVEKTLRNKKATLHLDDFAETLGQFESIDADNPLKIMSLLHRYQAAKKNQKAWDVYDVLLEMIAELEAAGGAEETDFEEQVRDASEFSAFVTKREQMLETVGGGY